MPAPSTGAIIEVQGALREVLPEIFRTRLPLILEYHRRERVRMLVTTRPDRRHEEADRSGNYFQPARQGRPPQFTWKASGILHNVIRQFRFDFLRNLGPEEKRCQIYMSIHYDNIPGVQPPSSAAKAGPGAAVRLNQEFDVAESAQAPDETAATTTAANNTALNEGIAFPFHDGMYGSAALIGGQRAEFVTDFTNYLSDRLSNCQRISVN